MIDGRTKEGKAAKKLREDCTPQELAARAAMARFGQTEEDGDSLHSDDEEICPHATNCGCRSCSWESMFSGRLGSDGIEDL